ncbi:hypothetical protein CD799_23215 [Pseudomonas aeruginosa]|nr:hypothetical protein CD799_23215 [Pseudomonas aeruginosa]AYZ84660.1 hypothetical protein EGY27_18075 [Pseudomonas aeruginosa]AYZ85526.1 hypothetical protein EGY27_22675 [Pseudomonas aeruginosa]KJC14142.1 hypothetical protein TO65_30185 [Pseudomonas aeruginosa]PTZ34731.1 hypothetical protein DB386_03690 [Pseudomonas aeruginosa]
MKKTISVLGALATFRYVDQLASSLMSLLKCLRDDRKDLFKMPARYLVADKGQNLILSLH